MDVRTVYFGELHYLVDQKAFAVEKALRLTIETVAQFCSHYTFEFGRDMKAGLLPADASERDKLLTELLEVVDFARLPSNGPRWVLRMDTSPPAEIYDVTMLEFQGDMSTFLYLPSSQFSQLQTIWRDNQLPEDLFFRDYVEVPSKGFFGRMLGKTKQVTPKRYEQAKGKGATHF